MNISNCGTETERGALLLLQDSSLSLKELSIQEQANLKIHGISPESPTCMYVGSTSGDRTGSIQTLDSVSVYLESCGCPSCEYGEQADMDLEFSVVIDEGTYVRVPSSLTLRDDVTFDLCGAVDGVQDGRVDVRSGGSFLASYPAKTGSLDHQNGILRINYFYVYQNGVFDASSRCVPRNSTELDFAVFETLFESHFDPTTFTLITSNATLEPAGDLLNETHCQEYGELVLLSGQNCSLDPVVYAYESITIHGGAFLKLLGDENNTLLTEISVGTLDIRPGGIIDGRGSGIADIGYESPDSGFGGSYGGYGGLTEEMPFGNISDPMDYGMFGSGTRGGGQLILKVQECAIIDGVIAMDGEDGIVQGQGGGSGGSLLIQTPCLRGYGSITSHGGSALSSSGGGGGGGGGRVSIQIEEDQYHFLGTISAHGGDGLEDGSSGTIFLKSHNDQTKLILSGSTFKKTPLFKETLGDITVIDNFHITNGYNLQLESDLTITKFHGDSTGFVHLAGNASLQLESVETAHVGTECSFDISKEASLVLPNGVVFSQSSSPALKLDGTLITESFTLGEGAIADVSGSIQTPAVLLQKASTLHLKAGASLGQSLESGVINVTHITIGVGAHLNVGDNLTIHTEELQMQEDSQVSCAADKKSLSIYCKTASIARGGTVSVDAGGVVAGIGTPSDYRSGASHGGEGGVYAGTAGTPFGVSISPRDPGCGVRHSSSGRSTRGGGVLIFEVEEDLQLDGTLSATGEDSPGTVGGGSGGSVHVVVKGTFEGHGSLKAHGGAGSGSSTSGGGGGRIAVSSQSDDGFYGTLTTYGGKGHTNGAAGTVYVTTGGTESKSSLTIDNGGSLTTGITVFDTYETDVTFQELTVKRYGQLRMDTPPASMITIDKLEGDNTGAMHISGDQRVFIAKDQAVATYYYLTCAFTISKDAEISLPPNIYISESSLTDTPFKLAGRLTDATNIVIGANAAMLIELTAHSAVSNGRNEYLFIDPPGSFSVNSIQIHGHGSLEFEYSTSIPIKLNLVTDLHVRYGGRVQAGWLDIKATSIEVEYEGSISSNGGGYGSGEGPCPGEDNPQGGSGACHGGKGGTASSGATTSKQVIGSLYGNKDFGSGGGSGGSGSPGIGGGMVLVEAGTMRVDGVISADCLASSGNSGGGSGGAVHVTTEAISGSGLFSATGGSGGETGGGGGGGGRIAIILTTPSKFTGDFSCHGGSASSGNQAGSSGTALVETKVGILTSHDLYINNAGADSPEPLLTLLNETHSEPHVFSKLTLLNDVILQIQGDDPKVVVDELVSDSSCLIRVHDTMILSVEADLDVAVFHCSFDVEKDGELRLPATVTFLGSSNHFSGESVV